MDLIPDENQKNEMFGEAIKKFQSKFAHFQIDFHMTSIWDNSLYTIISNILIGLIKYYDKIQNQIMIMKDMKK